MRKTFTMAVKQEGQVLVLFALCLVVLIGGVGLAIDSGMGYMIKAKLNAAVDSASVAAARAVTQGSTQAEQINNATQAAREFFAANYPNDYLGSTPTFNAPTVTFDQGKVIIDTSATASMPVSFMKIMGFKLLNVGASAQLVRKDLDLAFVMDTSGSMSGVASQVRSAAISFLQYFNPSADRVALIHFSTGAVVDDPIRTTTRGFNRTTLEGHIKNFSFSGYTNYAEGMWHGRNQLNSIPTNNRSSLRVILFFSDGSPNTFASYFSFKSGGCKTNVGSIATGDDGPGQPYGLYHFDLQNQEASGSCYQASDIAASIKNLPTYYNAHNQADQEFLVVTSSPRPVTNATSPESTAFMNINRAARNLPEAMAAKARDEGTYVFTLGLGARLRDNFAVSDSSGTKTGEDLLKCMANTLDAIPRCRHPDKPVGVYCYAATENDLKPCFAQLASEILRITR